MKTESLDDEWEELCVSSLVDSCSNVSQKKLQEYARKCKLVEDDEYTWTLDKNLHPTFALFTLPHWRRDPSEPVQMEYANVSVGANTCSIRLIDYTKREVDSRVQLVALPQIQGLIPAERINQTIDWAFCGSGFGGKRLTWIGYEKTLPKKQRCINLYTLDTSTLEIDIVSIPGPFQSKGANVNDKLVQCVYTVHDYHIYFRRTDQQDSSTHFFGVHTQTGEVDPLVVLPQGSYKFIGNEGNHIYLHEEKKNIVFHLEIRSGKLRQKLDISRIVCKTEEDQKNWSLIQVSDGPQRKSLLLLLITFHKNRAKMVIEQYKKLHFRSHTTQEHNFLFYLY